MPADKCVIADTDALGRRARKGPRGGTLASLAVGGERGYRRRLLELGFLPGTVVRLRGVAPTGDPLDVDIGGCRFSLRRAEAEAVRVASPALETVQP